MCPFDRTVAGGDGFDLDGVSGSDAESVAIRANGVSYIGSSALPHASTRTPERSTSATP